jgi:hypothetical protein
MTPKTLPEPAPAVTHIPAPTAKAALRRCCATYDRAYKAKFEECKHEREADFHARTVGNKAFLDAMPMLVGYEGARDFIACAAHGILINAIPHDRAGQLLYAAQVALATARHQPKTSQIPARKTAAPIPLPPKSATFDELFPLQLESNE